MFLPWLTGGIAALDLFIKDEIEREGTEEFPRDLPGTKGFIRIHKSYNPGFPFGFMKDMGDGIIVVAIRSALIMDNVLYAYAGCGVVADSDADEEYAETNNKMRTILEAL